MRSRAGCSCWLVMVLSSLAIAAHAADIRTAKDSMAYWVTKSNGDIWKKLPPDVQAVLEKDTGLSIEETLTQLSEISVPLVVEVRLIGLTSDAPHGAAHDAGLAISETELSWHLKALRPDMDTVVLDPELRALPVYPDISFKITRAPASISSRINAAVANAIMHQQEGKAASQYEEERMELAVIAHSLVDDILQTDMNRDPHASLTVYLLHVAKGHIPYPHLYSYASRHDGASPCPGAHWAGTDSLARYLWYDISAGPPSHGPGPGRKGGVLPHAAPHPSHYRQSALPKALVPDLAALAWSAAQHYLWPPLQHLPQPDFRARVVLQVIHMHDTLGPPSNRIRMDEIRHQLELAAGHLQVVEVVETWLSFTTCSACVTAFTNALRTRVSRDEDLYITAAKRTKFLDTASLRHTLNQNKDSIFADAGVHLDLDVNHLVVPVFVIHTSAELDPLLLSHEEQAAAFPDMVIAVVNRAQSYYSSWTCQYIKQFLDSEDVTRPLLAAMLTTVWGVANVSTTYTPATGVEINHMWGVGSSPFTPLSAHNALVPGAVSAIMGRNLALAQLNSSVTRMLRVIRGFTHLSRNGRFDGHSTREYKAAIMARVNLARYKVEHIALSLSRGQHRMAITFAKSLQFDAVQLERTAGKIGRGLEATLECKAGPGLASVWWAPLGALACWPLAVWLRGILTKHKADKYY